MKTRAECFPCFLRQTVIALRQLEGHEEREWEIIGAVLSIMGDADTERPPAYITTFIHRLVRERLGLDPFDEIKRRFNALALERYPELKEKVLRSEDPLWTAARLAIAGNVIDFGIYTHIDMDLSIERALEVNIAVDDYAFFRRAVSGADSILYLLDNAGEIVFDRLLIEELVSRGISVTAVVKGAPVLNDATMDDAIQAGLHTVCHVVDNGSDAIGTILEWTSPEFRQAFRNAPLVLSKGQGNFETLVSTEQSIYFLFQAKCDVVARELNLSPGSMLLMESPAPRGPEDQ